MFELLTIVTTITGIFTILDLFIEKNAKAKVAEFVFGFGTADFTGFESNAITALLSLFKVDGKLSYKRILFRYSGSISILLSLTSIILTYGFKIDALRSDYESELLEFLELIVGIPIVALLFWPFDCWSLKVTDRIFGTKKTTSILGFFGRVFADIFITLLPLALFAAGIFLSLTLLSMAENGGTVTSSVLVAILAGGILFTALNVFGSLLVTIIQLLTLAIGVCLRAILRLTKLNQHLAMVSRAHEFPFTFIGLVFGITLSLFAVPFT